MARIDAENYEAEYEEETYDLQSSFKNGVIERICEIGYEDDKDDISKVTDFVCAKFKEHSISIRKKDEDRTRIDIKNWLSGGAPNDSEQSRPNVYKLCFALEMNVEQTRAFFLKKYLCRPFNFKKTDEAVYYFCLNTGRNYDKALELIEKVEVLPCTSTAENIETRLIEIPLSEITTEEDFLSYMKNHRYDKNEQHQTVVKEIESLIEECKELAGVKKDAALLREILGYDERKVIVFDEEKGEEKAFGISKSKLPEAIKTNFPRAINFSQIKNREATDDTYRKMLVILCFFKYYISLKNAILKSDISEKHMDLSEYFDEFEITLDQLLEKCGYVQVYWRNPFDRFILLCAKQQNPLEELKWLLQTYYLDVADEMQ
ncbi:MAG: hypothetical protein IJC88_01970 [Oscillospiraceae bacterium]|nr:hypothetical protein [Oscillospiraceae bacterium]MBQ6902443.1 hypothetical protein [Oscillospiraceae bacterium]